MKRRVIGSVLPTTKVTISPRGSSLRILKRSSFVLAFTVPTKLQQTSVLHHLQGRGPHFLFPFLILNNLQILCHLTPLMHQPSILSNLSKASLVKMKIIQFTWPTLTFPIFLADPSFYHLRIMGSAAWPKSLTLMTIKFKLKINKDQAEEIMSYNQLMDYIQKGTDAEEDPDSLFKFRDIVAHQGPLESTDPNHKGS